MLRLPSLSALFHSNMPEAIRLDFRPQEYGHILPCPDLPNKHIGFFLTFQWLTKVWILLRAKPLQRFLLILVFPFQLRQSVRP